MKELDKQLKDEYIIAAIDPSLKCTGYSILKVCFSQEANWHNKCIKLIDYGIIPTHNQAHGQQLISFEKTITEVIDKYKPDYVTSEAPFAGKNRDTIQKLAHIHGILQLVCAKINLDIVYYSVMTAKSQTLGGIKTKKEDGTKKTGDEMKAEVCAKVEEILGKESFFKEYNFDVTDSISMGLCFVAMNGKTTKEIEKEKNDLKKKKDKEKSKELKNEKTKKASK
jgi:Holliday junction resolvasome RuvABC endonuclease subunit